MNLELLVEFRAGLIRASIPKVLVSMGLGMVGVLLVSCSPLLSSVSTAQYVSLGTSVSQSPIITQENRGQMLPITAKAKIGSQVIGLEVAKTPQQQALGLMYRTDIADDRGMLFPLAQPGVVGFWMKNCKMPLDMIFLRNDVVKAIQVNAPPCQQEPCPTYGPNLPVDQVIELRGGRSQELGVKVGDRIPISFVNSQP